MINSFLSTGWGKKEPIGRSGFFFLIFFIFSIFHFSVTRMLRKKKLFSKTMKKKFQSALFSLLGRWTANYFLFKGGVITKGSYYSFIFLVMLVYINIMKTSYPWRKAWSRCSTSLQNCQSWLVRTTSLCPELNWYSWIWGKETSRVKLHVNIRSDL